MNYVASKKEASNTMSSVFSKPIHNLYVKAFNANKYVAGLGFASAITLVLFFVMVILIALGDSGLKKILL